MERPWFYTLAFDMGGLAVSTFANVTEWALLINETFFDEICERLAAGEATL